jgi:hypothetical protein
MQSALYIPFILYILYNSNCHGTQKVKLPSTSTRNKHAKKINLFCLCYLHNKMLSISDLYTCF